VRISRVAFACAALLAVLAAGAFAGSIEVGGQLLGAPIPPHYRLTGAEMYFKDGKAYIEVRGEGDCHYEFHQECSWTGGNPPQYVCHQVPVWTCVQDLATHALPAGAVTLQDKDVFYNAGGHALKIGVVKSFLFWKWIALLDNARIHATQSTAKLVVNPGSRAPEVDRTTTFARLHTEPTVDLLVKFQGVDVATARTLLRRAGYDGVLAPTNNWTDGDVTRDELGIRLPVKQAAALIAKIKTLDKVVGVRPAGTAQSE
jgi:hypothetical protein